MAGTRRTRGTRGVTVDDVRDAALSLPDTIERPSYGTPGFRAKDRLFARVLDDETIVARVDLGSRDIIVDARPDIFSVTAHYEAYPWVVVHLPALGVRELRDVLAEARTLAIGTPRATRSRKRAR